MAVLAVGGDDRVVRGQGLHRPDGDRLFADVEMEEAVDLARACTVRRTSPRTGECSSIWRSSSSACSRSTDAAGRKLSAGLALAIQASSSVDVSPSGSPSSRALSSRRMILPLRVFGRLRRNSISFGATAAPSRVRAKPSSSRLSVRRRLAAVLEDDEGLDDLHRDRVRLADHAGLGDGRVLHQDALDLERADQVAGGLDHVVRAADEPEVAVRDHASPGRRSGSSHRRSTSRSAPAHSSSRGTSTASRAAAPARPATSGSSTTSTLAVGALAHDGRFDAGQRPAHRAGPDVHGGVVGDHDAAGLRLPPVVVERQAEGLLAPDDGLGVERLADAGQEAQRRRVDSCGPGRRPPSSSCGSPSAPCTRR